MKVAKGLRWVAITCFWVLVWQAVSMLVANTLLLAGPLDVCAALAHDLVAPSFWLTIWHTFWRILAGFACAWALALPLGVAASRSAVFREVFGPFVSFIKSVPIVCIIVVLLIWFGSSMVSAIAVFLVVFPPVYFAVIGGMGAVDVRMREMFTVFRSPASVRIRALYRPALAPFLRSAAEVVVGMSWKAGVAAELIGLPLGTIGERVYQSKITLSSADLFAWTLVVVLVSLACEKIFLTLLRTGDDRSLAYAARGRHTLSQGKGEGSARVEIDHVLKRFGDQVVFSGCTFTLEAGTRYALCGPSGSGKTTMLYLLAGLLSPEAGAIGGRPAVSMVFQENRLVECLSAVGNILLVTGGSRTPEEVRELLSRILPAEVLDRPVSEYSGGMKRRVELCRALAMPSGLVLLDEPFSGLDEDNHSRALRLLTDALGDRMLVIATHDRRDLEALRAEELPL